MDLLADTTFLIDLWREQRRPGSATRFARKHPDRTLGVCWVTAGEFLSGAVDAGHDPDIIRAFLSRYPILQSGMAIAERYAALHSILRRSGRLIGPNDLWIAATAAVHELPILTRNITEYGRVPELRIETYASS